MMKIAVILAVSAALLFTRPPCSPRAMMKALDKAILAELVAPATAEITVTQRERRPWGQGCEIDVTGYVDAENRMGALLRTEFTANVRQWSRGGTPMVYFSLEPRS